MNKYLFSSNFIVSLDNIDYIEFDEDDRCITINKKYNNDLLLNFCVDMVQWQLFCLDFINFVNSTDFSFFDLTKYNIKGEDNNG